MTIQTVISHEKETTIQLLEALFLTENLEGIRVRLWDDSIWPEYGEASTMLVLNHPGALRAMLLPGTELGMAEAYLYNDIAIVGNIEAIFDLADDLTHAVGSLRKK